MTKNILLAGVGGQGTILAAKMLTIALMEEGYDVKMSEIHGMSQRGGSVTSQVRYSDNKVFSPVIEKGTADILVAFEEMEALRNLDYIRPEATVVVNSERIPSSTVQTGSEIYYEYVIDEIKKTANNVSVIEASREARQLGNVKAANVILLGALAQAMHLQDLDWESIIRCNVKARFADMNLKAFEIGKQAVG